MNGDKVRANRAVRGADKAHARAAILADKAPTEEAPPMPVLPGGRLAAVWAGWAAQYGPWPWGNPRFRSAVCHEVNAPEGFEVPPLVAGSPLRAIEVRELREHAGLPVETVAELLQVPAEMLTAFETGTTVETSVPELDVSRRFSADPRFQRDFIVTRFEPGDMVSRPDLVSPAVAARLYSALAVTRAVGATPPVIVEPPAEVAAPHGAGRRRAAGRRTGRRRRAAHAGAGHPHIRADGAGCHRRHRRPDAAQLPERAHGRRVVLGVPRPGPAPAVRSCGRAGAGSPRSWKATPTEAPYVPHDELGVGPAGLLRCLGVIAAIVAEHPELAESRDRPQRPRPRREPPLAVQAAVRGPLGRRASGAGPGAGRG